jgi:hypothetical protein
MGSSTKVERPDSRAGFRWSVGRACGSFRLQKSTSGAWPCAPGRDERTEATGSSSSSFGSAGRKSVGSRVGAAKSRDRWRVRVRGLFRVSGVGRAGTRRWKMPWVVGAVAFDEAAVKAVLAARAALRRTRVATRVSKVVTFGPSAEDNAADRGCHLWARLDREPSRIGWHPHPPDRREREGDGCSSRRVVKRVVTRVVRWGFGSIGRGELRASEAATSGVE